MRPLHYGIRFGEGGEAGGEGEGGETGGGGGDGEGIQTEVYIYVCRTPWNVLPWQCNNITALLIVAVF